MGVLPSFSSCAFREQEDGQAASFFPLSDKVFFHQYNAQPMTTVNPAAPKQPLASNLFDGRGKSMSVLVPLVGFWVRPTR